MLDILVQKRKDKQVALRFFRKLLKGQGRSPNKLITDKLRSYGAAKKELMPSTVHCQDRDANNRVENSHQHTRQHERRMWRFNRLDKPNDFSPFTVRYTISFASDVT